MVEARSVNVKNTTTTTKSHTLSLANPTEAEGSKLREQEQTRRRKRRNLAVVPAVVPATHSTTAKPGEKLVTSTTEVTVVSGNDPWSLANLFHFSLDIYIQQ